MWKQAVNPGLGVSQESAFIIKRTTSKAITAISVLAIFAFFLCARFKSIRIMKKIITSLNELKGIPPSCDFAIAEGKEKDIISKTLKVIRLLGNNFESLKLDTSAKPFSTN
jgi:hypothetical protein